MFLDFFGFILYQLVFRLRTLLRESKNDYILEIRVLDSINLEIKCMDALMNFPKQSLNSMDFLNLPGKI